MFAKLAEASVTCLVHVPVIFEPVHSCMKEVL